MEFVLPFVALGGMYIISNRTNEGFENDNNENDQNNNIPLLRSEIEYNRDENLQNNEQDDLNQTTDVFFNKENVSSTNYTSTLSGEKMTDDQFQHNNMVPFFGAKIKGNYDDYKLNESILDNMTGSGSQMKSKEERAPLFTPAENMNYANGAPNMNDFYQSRVNPSMNMSNIKPWKEERVAPGLNKGYTTEGSSGLNSALEAREHFMPKNVDDLRIESNKKETYCLTGHEGPLSAPIKERGQFGAMEKHLPDRYYESGENRWFTTTGIEKKQTVRSQHNNKEEHRETTAREYEGGARGNNYINYSKNTFVPSERDQLGQEQFTPASASDKHKAHPNDYGSKNYLDYKNNRTVNKNNHGFGIVGSTLGAVISPLIEVLRPTRKENIIGNIRIHGDIAPNLPKSYINNQRNIRVTNRQMNPESLGHYNVQNQHDSSGGYVIDNNTVVPTNRNETTTYYSGVMNGPQEGVTTYDSAYNQTNNDKKEATTYNRTSQGNTQIFSQLNSEHNVAKQDSDRDNNRMWIPNRNMAQLPPSVETCGLTNTPTTVEENNRIQPDLLEAFKQNPYTHSLSSVA
jgi:hypothetical protein